MDYLSIDYLIVYSFLLITLVVGLWASRGIKDIREYAIANKMYGKGVLTMTILATYITGSKGIGFIGQVFDNGIIPLLPVLGCGVVCCFGFITLFVAPRMQHFQGCLTAAELMGKVYGQRTRYTVALLGVVYSLTLVGKQIAWLGTLGGLIDTPNQVVMLVVGSCLLLYAAQGGIKSVTATDIVHFVAITSIIPLVAYFLLHKVGSAKTLFTALPRDYLDIAHHPNLQGYLFHSIWYLFPAFPLSFPFIQHMLMAKNTKNLIASYQIVTLFLVIFFLLLALIGLSAIVIRRDIDGNMPAEGGEVFIYMVNNYFSIPFRGLIVVGLFAGVMSTADSFLHTSGLLLTHDFIQPLCKRSNYLISEHQVIKLVTVLLGAIVLWGACNNLNFPLYVNGLSLSEALNIITTPVALVFTVPLIAAIMGLKGNEGSFFIAFFSTIVVFILSYLYLPTQLVIPVGIVTNTLTFFGSHFLRNKSFVTVGHQVDEQVVQHGVPARNKVRISPIKLLSALRKVSVRSRTKLAGYDSEPELFALWLLFNYMAPIFMHSYTDLVAYNWLLSIRSLGALLCVGLLLKSYWPKQLLTYFPAYYHFSLLYCLPFVSTFLFLLEGGNIEWVVNMTLAIMLLIVLVDWVSFIVLSVGGVFLGIVGYSLLVDHTPLTLSASTSYTLVYACLFSTLIGLIFARRKEQRFDKLATDNEALEAIDLVHRENLLEAFREKVRIIQTLKHAGIQNLLQVAKLIKDLRIKDATTPLSEVAPHLEATLIPMALQLQGIEHRATDYLRLQVETLSIESLLQKVQEQLPDKGKNKGAHYQLLAQHDVVECDPTRITTLLVNSITSLQPSADKEQPILVGIEDTQLHYALPSVQAGYTKKIAALRLTITTKHNLPALQKAYMAQINGSLLSNPQSAQALVLLDNQRTIKAHYGYSSVARDTQFYVIPVWLREVRSEDMDRSYMELGVAPIRADDHYPGARAQEREFLTAVARQTTTNIKIVKTVLEIIKWYHGPMSRKTGEPFYLHPLAVAHIVLDYNQDEATILGALLHDTVEDTHMLLDHIETFFGEDTAGIVNKVTHLESTKNSCYKVKLSAAENILMLLETGDDRAMFVKLADRVHNLRTIEAQSYTSQERTARETLQFFVPQAQRLGLHKTAQELQARSMKVLGKVF